MIPRKLEMYDFLSHKKSCIDFDKFDSALILGSFHNSMDESNGSGKSSILEAIRWVLLDKSRHKKKDGVVKHTSDSCKVIFVFDIGGSTYRITRQRNKVINQSDVILEQWSGLNFETIGCDTNTATDKKIVDIISFNDDIFINSVYFKQGDISLFTDSTPSKRKDILKSLLKLEKWDAYQKCAKKVYSKLSAQLTEKQTNVIPIEEIENDLEDHKNIISDLKKTISAKNKKYKEISASVVSKKSEYQMVSEDSVGKQQLAALQKEYTEAKKKLGKIKRDISSNDKIIEGHSALIQKANEKLIIIEDSIKAKEGLDISQKKLKLLSGKAQEKLMRDQLTELKRDIKLEKECSYCLRPIKSSAEAKHIKSLREEKLKELKDRHSTLSKKIKSSDAKLKSLENIVEKGNKAEIDKSKIKVKINSMENERDQALSDNIQLQKDKKIIGSIDYLSRINELKDKFNEEHINNLKDDILTEERELASLKRSIDKMNINYGSKVSNRDDLIKKRDQQEILYDEIQGIYDELAVYDKLKHYFGKDGIQSIIIENVVDELENYTNLTLSKICNEPTSISIQVERQNENSGSWVETFDIEVSSGSRKGDLDSFSGGEKFRISLALRLALSKILSKRMGGAVQFLLLDEVSSSLDTKGLNMFADIVKQLSSEMKILIITHDDRLKDKFDDIIVVKKTADGSFANN